MRGLSKELIREGLRLCRQRGYRFSHLYPFLHSFYARLGYGVANRRKLASLRASQAILLPQPHKVRPMDGDDASAALACYRRFMEGKNGYVIRSSMEGRLKEHLLESPAVAALYPNGDMAGYCLCYFENGVLIADEMVYDSPEALESLAAAMGSLQKPEGEIRFTLPEWEALPENWGAAPRRRIMPWRGSSTWTDLPFRRRNRPRGTLSCGFLTTFSRSRRGYTGPSQRTAK